jgi:hypothetical protein
MPTKQESLDYVQALRQRQADLRAEARPFEAGDIRIGRPLPGYQHEDLTAMHIAAIHGEIASIEKTIQRVFAEVGAEI